MIQSIPDGKHHVPDYHFSLIEQSDLCNQYVRLWTQMTNQHTNKSTAVECYSWCFFIWIYILASLCAWLNVQLSCGHMSQMWVCVCETEWKESEMTWEGCGCRGVSKHADLFRYQRNIYFIWMNDFVTFYIWLYLHEHLNSFSLLHKLKLWLSIHLIFIFFSLLANHVYLFHLRSICLL